MTRSLVCVQPPSIAVQLEQREEEVRFLRQTVQKQDERIRALEQRLKQRDVRAGRSALRSALRCRSVGPSQTAHPFGIPEAEEDVSERAARRPPTGRASSRRGAAPGQGACEQRATHPRQRRARARGASGGTQSSAVRSTVIENCVSGHAPSLGMSSAPPSSSGRRTRANAGRP